MLKLVFTLILLSFSSFASEKIIVGISGGTGSGKTTLAQRIKDNFSGQIIVLSQDSYYKDFSNLSIEKRSQINFDHPESLDFELLKSHLLALKNDQAIEQPQYDFCSHSRLKSSDRVSSAQVILVEGILLFAVPEIRDLFDVKIFIDADDDIRLLRRMERDMRDRGRDFQGIKDQYIKTVKPMHDKFVQPSKQFADMIVLNGADNPKTLSLILSKLRETL